MMTPTTIAAAVAEIALNSKVQDATVSLARRVYGKVFSSEPNDLESSTSTAAPVTLEEVADQLARMPTQEELAVAFSLLQAELDRQHQRTRLLMIVNMICLIGLAALVLI